MRYFLRLSYFGMRYSGWQVQEHDTTVQETINNAIAKLLNRHTTSVGCGRTDTGVHAKDFYMHFDTERVLDTEDFKFRLNCVLPDDIAIHEVFAVHEKAHTRFDATARTYEYFIHFHKNPFLEKLSVYQGFYRIDWQKVEEATRALTQVKDFTSLCLKSEDFKTNLCDVSVAKWDVLPALECVLSNFDKSKKYNELISLNESDFGVRFTITSNRFLRGMVRRIVGSLLVVGKGKISVEQFIDTVVNQQKFRIIITSPAKGLYLSKIEYPYIKNGVYERPLSSANAAKQVEAVSFGKSKIAEE